MSESNTQLPSFEKSAELLSNVDAQAYFNRLAECGIVPQTEKEAQALLEIGFRLEQAEGESGSTKQASDPYSSALNDLNAVLDNNGFQKHKQDRHLKLAQAFASDPSVYAATIGYAQGLAEQAGN